MLLLLMAFLICYVKKLIRCNTSDTQKQPDEWQPPLWQGFMPITWAKGTGGEVKSLVLVRLSKCVPANHSEEMKKRGGEKRKKSQRHTFQSLTIRGMGKEQGGENSLWTLFFPSLPFSSCRWQMSFKIAEILFNS